MVLALACAVLLPSDLWASSAATSPLPVINMLQQLADLCTGPVARLFSTITFVACGVIWATTRADEGMKKFTNGAIGGGIASGAAALVGWLGIGGGII